MKKLLIILLIGLSFTLNAQTPLLIEGQNETLTTSWGYIVPKNSPTLLTFRNNRYISTFSTSGSGNIVQVGDDNYYPSTAHNLDGASVRGNVIKWEGTANGVHGFLAGYNINYDFKYNYIENCRYGIVHEGGYPDHTRMVNDWAIIAYNIFKNGQYFSIVEKGHDGTRIYNNTFYNNDPTKLCFILLKSSDTGGITEPYPTTKNTKIKNNIFYSTSNNTYAFRIGTSDDDTEAEMDTVGLEIDYNVYYYPNRSGGEPVFAFRDVEYSWTQWRALGYDEHSVVIDPDFVDTETLVPSARLDYGIDVGAIHSRNDLDYGLSTIADWVVGEYPDTTIQGDVWQVGARVYETPVIHHADFYVATDGNDSNPGTFELPWATWGKAFNSTAVQPGDTVYFRGGVYPMTSNDLAYPYTTGSGYNFSRNGTAENYICYFAYPGENPILDCGNINLASGTNRGIVGNEMSYIHLKGLTLRNVKQSQSGNTVTGWTISGNNIIVENCTVHNTGGWGFLSVGKDIYYLNCDSHHNCDSLTSSLPGNDGVGFQNVNQSEVEGSVYYKNCRAWMNGDQGFSAVSIGYLEFDGCWSFNNGQLQGEGHGFKMASVGSGGLQPVFGPLKRKYSNNLAVYNRANGFTTNDSYPDRTFGMQVYNNLSYHNGYPTSPFNMSYGYVVYNTASIDAEELARVFRNNIAYDNFDGATFISSGALYTHSNNSWDGGATIDATDFAALPATQEAGIALLMGARGINGALPNLGNYFKLAVGSDAIDAGINVGLPYKGSAPDLGPFEYDSPIMGIIGAIGKTVVVGSYIASVGLDASGTISNGGPIIADHTVVDKYNDIPQIWIDEVKKMWVSIAGESHSEAYRSGAQLLENQNSKFAVSIRDAGTPEAYTTNNLRLSRATWGDLNNSSGWIYSYGEEDWYKSTTAVNRTKAGLDYYNNTGPELAAFGLGWCWDTEEWADDMATYNSVTQEYEDYCRNNNYLTKVLFTTGPVDGYNASGVVGWNKYLAYEAIRDYVSQTDNAILFDYADILCYDDDGTGPNTASYNGNVFPIITQTNVSPEQTGHISNAGALRLAKALWWMLARIAGWDGN